MVNGVNSIGFIDTIESLSILFGLILIIVLPMIHILKGEKPLKFVFIIWFYIIIWALFFDGPSPQLAAALMAGWIHGVVIVGFSLLLKKLIDLIRKYMQTQDGSSSPPSQSTITEQHITELASEK